jgi:hypothetical protein
MRLFQNFSFWNSFPECKGKTGAFDRFFQKPVPKPCALAHSQLVLEQAHIYEIIEVMYNLAGEDIANIFHAMKCRKEFLRILPERGYYADFD